jgi:hypothetical protein
MGTNVIHTGSNGHCRLRDHPLMRRKSGIPSWPPQWQPVGEANGIIQGELGILEDVSMSDSINNKIFLAMGHLGDRYVSVIAFDDSTFARQLYPSLLKNIGRTIKDIGDLDLSHTL